ncbi:hypothetical protein BD310DRAFT_1001343 [Dichomitus squalens]|uniref:Uncharacterized protein n=1 Tax=Dichomitus squalens TaxID=114155 RepID=A0A4Q9QCB4_9APHY|nr:hypothetical protein BD310DRAFT_1001343 [Dichomitus squalens]
MHSPTKSFSMVPGVSPLALPVPRSLGVVCQVGLTDLGGGSPLSRQPLRPTETMATASSLPRNTRSLDKTWLVPLRWEGIMVTPVVVDAPRSHPSRTFRNPAVTTPRILLETRNREDGDLSRSMGYVVVPLYPNIQRTLYWMVAMRVMCE